MTQQKTVAVIPARYGSSRFPGKPLAMLGDAPVVVWVVRTALEAVGRAIVATDDERILEAVTSRGYEAVMTSAAHRSGTDRVCEAVEKGAADADIVINVQGDEPFVTAGQIRQLAECFRRTPVPDIATLVRPYAADGSYEGLADPNRPKVELADDGSALTFSRSVIPYIRGAAKEEWPRLHRFWMHVGMYAYRADILRRIVKLPPSPLESVESLEQMRWLQAGFRIATAVTDDATVGIDTPEDLEQARRILAAGRPG